MKTIEEIQNQEAIKLGYESFRDLLLNPKDGFKMQHTIWWNENCMKQYSSERINKFLCDVSNKIIEGKLPPY